MDDQFNLVRFVIAQDTGGTFERAVAELARGRKVSHWMWFVFPQIAGLGRSATAMTYAISSLAEARAYLRHEILGPRLLQCSSVVASLSGMTAEEIFGSIDAAKLRSSMTLFSRADPDQPIFRRVMDLYFDGAADEMTLKRLGRR